MPPPHNTLRDANERVRHTVAYKNGRPSSTPLLLADELAEDPLLDAAELLVAREEEVLEEEGEERLLRPSLCC